MTATVIGALTAEVTADGTVTLTDPAGHRDPLVGRTLTFTWLDGRTEPATVHNVNHTDRLAYVSWPASLRTLPAGECTRHAPSFNRACAWCTLPGATVERPASWVDLNRLTEDHDG